MKKITYCIGSKHGYKKKPEEVKKEGNTLRVKIIDHLGFGSKTWGG